MNTVLKFIIILFISNNIFSQNEEKVYIILDNSNLYEIIKKENSATLKIPFYSQRANWKKENSKKTNKDNEEVVVVSPIPNKKYYTFHSIKAPEKRTNINEINAFSVIDVSKENKMVWKKYPHKMIFIEKVNCKSYRLWYMMPEFYE